MRFIFSAFLIFSFFLSFNLLAMDEGAEVPTNDVYNRETIIKFYDTHPELMASLKRLGFGLGILCAGYALGGTDFLKKINAAVGDDAKLVKILVESSARARSGAALVACGAISAGVECLVLFHKMIEACTHVELLDGAED